jgi:hypothetical protein
MHNEPVIVTLASHRGTAARHHMIHDLIKDRPKFLIAREPAHMFRRKSSVLQPASRQSPRALP